MRGGLGGADYSPLDCSREQNRFASAKTRFELLQARPLLDRYRKREPLAHYQRRVTWIHTDEQASIQPRNRPTLQAELNRYKHTGHHTNPTMLSKRVLSPPKLG
jgi:hypothetical protein